jgi:AcrR family transcriptional regulator
MATAAKSEKRDQTSPRVLRRQERTRQSIITAATEQFAQKSYATVSVEQIIEAADISRGTFYKLFKDKAEVLAEILQPLMQLYGSQLATIDSADPWEIIDRMIDVYIRIWRDAPTAFSLSQKDSTGIFHLIEKSHRPAMTHMYRLFKIVESHNILRAERAEEAMALMARSAVIVLRVYDGQPEWERLFAESMRGLLLTQNRPNNLVSTPSTGR